MTVSLAIVRPTFAVAAADRLQFGLDRNDRTVARRLAQKVVLAPRAPAAVITNNLRYVGSVPINVFVQGVLDGLEGPTQAERVAAALADALASRVAAMIDEAKRSGTWSEYLRSDLVVASHGPSGAELLVVHIAEAVDVEVFGENGLVGVVRAPQPALDVINNPERRWRGDGIDAPTELVAHAESIITESIAADLAADPARIHTGGGVEVALVDERGARFAVSRGIDGWR